MATRAGRAHIIAQGTCVLVAVAALLLLPRPGLALPPRPTVPPTPTPTSTPGPGPGPGPAPVPASACPGGTIALRILFPPTWPWDDVSWQDVWTVVQWQHPDGTWHDVEGWQGAPDSVALSGAWGIVAVKTWWVAQADFGKGPFRWVAYEGETGPPLAASEPFHLPESANGATVVEVTLTP